MRAVFALGLAVSIAAFVAGCSSPAGNAALADWCRHLQGIGPHAVRRHGIRNLFAGQPVGNDIWVALAWCVGILVVAYGFAMLTYRRKIA